MALLAALKPRAPFERLVIYDKDRLGREQFEMSYPLKKIDQAGVKIFEAKGGGRALVFDSPIDKMVMSVLGFAEELGRARGPAMPSSARSSGATSPGESASATTTW